GACPAILVGVWPYCPTFPPQAASAVRAGVPPRDAAAIRELGGNHGDKAGCLSVGSVPIASGKCFLLPGDNIIPNNLTIPCGQLVRRTQNCPQLECASQGKKLVGAVVQ